MPILTADQRQELVDKRTLQETTLANYSSVSFQEVLRQGVVDAQAVDDGIKAIFDFCDDEVIGNYYGERINLDAQRVFEDVNEKYTDSRLVVPPATFEDEVMTLGELSDDYLDVISEGIIARGSTLPSFTPTDVRRIFPLTPITDITRFEQFDGTPITRDTISPNIWLIEPIVNAETFFNLYEGQIATFSDGGRPTNTASFVRVGSATTIGSQTGIIQSYTLTATTPSTMGSTNMATASVGQQFVSTDGDRVEVLVGGTASSTAGSMTDPATIITATIVCGVLNASQRVQALSGQTDNLELERAFFIDNLNTGKSTTNLALIDARIAEVVPGGSSDATNRSRRRTEITTRLAEITAALPSFFDRRFDSANQRANFADGTLGALKGKLSNFESFKVMIDSDTTTVDDGTEIVRLKESIANITSQIEFSDAQP